MSKFEILTTGGVARRLGVNRWQVAYLFEARKLSEPERIGGHRVFAPDDMERIAAMLRRQGTLPPVRTTAPASPTPPPHAA